MPEQKDGQNRAEHGIGLPWQRFEEVEHYPAATPELEQDPEHDRHDISLAKAPTTKPTTTSNPNPAPRMAAGRLGGFSGIMAGLPRWWPA
jgi:hypothetical protein